MQFITEKLVGDSVKLADGATGIYITILLNPSISSDVKKEILNDLKIEATKKERQEPEEQPVVFRILEVFVRSSADNEEVFKFCLEQGCINLIFDKLKSEDILEVLNVYELVEKFCKSRHTFEWFSSSGMANNMISKLTTEDEYGDLAKEKIMQVFINLARQKNEVPALLTKLKLLDVMLENLNQGNLVGLTISAFGAIGCTSEGLNYINQHISDIGSVFENSLKYSDIDLKIAVLSSIAEILESKSLNEQTISNVFNSICTNPPLAQLCNEFLRSSFYELRHASYSLLFSLSKSTAWGINNIVNAPALLENLLNRDAEVIPEGLSWRYAILKRLFENEHAVTILSTDQYNAINFYLRVPSNTQVKIK
eukprot:TRINITY_DN6520_c0_g1_i1.p1 TRINITY_DN6520_c0_g1~~TRINITY_DN6520_c0_g1_i1.p1  ORF type:complete len:368 (-),score=62.66 TRINITY_DN6520_c0_g1_i1:22-1125(-)